MTREQALEKLKELQDEGIGDPETAHGEADGVLCDLLTALGFGDVVAEWRKVSKWYA